jgi:uncharacterized protein YprB with RNaseH-like and TPR domain
MALTLRDRLDRLRREPSPGPPPDVPRDAQEKDTGELDRLEQRLLGQVQAELPLRERLMRLAAAAARGRGAAAAPAPPPAPAPLEEVVAGTRVANERGEFFRIEDDVHLETHHGAVPLSRFRLPAPGSVGVLAGDATLEGFELARAVFLDTETTGLAGGTGTAAFLVGIGFVEGDRFRVRQYFMRDYHEEAALLRGLAQDLARFAQVVTFNGKQFDLPLLETRFHLARERYPLGAARHLDLLHPARRLWKRRLASCTLQHLEQDLLGLWRRGDLPGSEIPQLYFDYVRRRDARAMARIFRHNRTDVVSLAALAVLACQWVEEERAEDPRDVLSLARVLERAGRAERCEAQYRRLLEGAGGEERRESLVRLARRRRRAGDHEGAAALWEEAAACGHVPAWRELALHHEHRARDPRAALLAVDRALAGLERGPRPLLADLRHRRRRLLAKLSRPPA